MIFGSFIVWRPAGARPPQKFLSHSKRWGVVCQFGGLQKAAFFFIIGTIVTCVSKKEACMTFLSLSFAAFAALLFAAWWGAPAKARPLVLAAANLVFALSLVCTPWPPCWRSRPSAGRPGCGWPAARAKRPLAVGCAGCLAPLLAYKYLALAAAALGWPGLCGSWPPRPASALHLQGRGLSRRGVQGRLRPEKSALHYFNYTGFFCPAGQRADPGPRQPAAPTGRPAPAL